VLCCDSAADVRQHAFVAEFEPGFLEQLGDHGHVGREPEPVEDPLPVQRVVVCCHAAIINPEAAHRKIADVKERFDIALASEVFGAS